MALGGGTFTAMNKILPGVYVNAQSTDLATLENSDRGILALPMLMSWGAEEKVITVTAETLKDEISCYKIFGYPYSADEMKPIRDIFKGATKLLLYRANGGGTVAKLKQGETEVGEVKYAGARGNDINVQVDNSSHVVTTYIGCVKVAEDSIGEDALKTYENDFVKIDIPSVTASDAETASEADTSTAAETVYSITASGGSDGTVTGETIKNFTEAIESYSYNVLCCPYTDGTIQETLIAFTKRARADLGLNAQIVISGASRGDSGDESVVVLDRAQANAIYWVAGQLAGVQVGDSVTGMEYGGEYELETSYSKAQLEAHISNGVFVIHNVNGTPRVLKDINSLTTYTEKKSKLFSDNATIRVIDRISNDVGVVFAKYVYGKTKNNDLGRTLLKSDIYDVLADIANTQAIEAVDLEDIKVEYASKNAVSVTIPVVLVGTIDQIYITVSIA